ncbi:MFS transporter [Anditalea andensis]|uniref:MFS transporter n=1 Tax=Anditalea andensis TaxID=1048983 RepID=A0A074KX39_9BACT|nr:MFS transporter [Anditalea andensis]KEO72138.1 MFS transporter [Anditalea andensis]
MNYIQFIRRNKTMSFFGAMMTTLSSFGQTFLLSLYIPYLIEEFAITNSLISSLYGIATIASALILPKLGKYIDTVPLKNFTLMTTGIFLSALVFFSFSRSWWYLPIAFFGLRLAGQGLYSHIAITTMSRYFVENRGKAISIASLGHPLGQAILPALTLLVIAQIGWRESLWLNAALVGLIVTVFTIFAIKPKHLQTESEVKVENGGGVDRPATKVRQRDILRSKPFWLLAPNVFFVPFAITGLFFYQFSIIAYKGWGIEYIALGLTAYAIASTFSILTAGPLIDRFNAKTFFPFYLLPFLGALLVIYLVDSQWGIFLYMVLMGLSTGFGNATMAALQVEFFGQTYIGTVRSLFTSIMVLSSAVGPALYGVILDAGWGFDTVFISSMVILIIIIIQSFKAIPAYTISKWKYRFRHRKNIK